METKLLSLLFRRLGAFGATFFLCISCSTRVPLLSTGDDPVGYASWYGHPFHGRQTASGEIYDMNQMTAAHRHAAFGSHVKVTHLETGRCVVVRINDRGPFVKGRIIDLSFKAAKQLGLVGQGTAKVRLTFFEGKTPSTAPVQPYVQVGSFRQAENAQRLLEEMSNLLPQHTPTIKKANNLYRVWLGPLDNDQKAGDLAKDLKNAGYNALILHR